MNLTKKIQYKKPKILIKKISSSLYVKDISLIESNLIAQVTCGPCGENACGTPVCGY